jgi:hypothetical protein
MTRALNARWEARRIGRCGTRYVNDITAYLDVQNSFMRDEGVLSTLFTPESVVCW